MADQREGGIAWTDQTWNPTRGCTRISEGCRNCYAEGVAARFSAPGLAYAGLARQSDHGPRWTGKVVMVPDHLDDPVRWKRPRRIFVNSMSDLFHEKLTDDQVASVFHVMLAAPRHTYQVLTKRAERMQRFVEAFCAERGWLTLPSFIHLGVSAEDQPNYDERAHWLLKTRAAVRFISAEPLLGPIDCQAHLGFSASWDRHVGPCRHGRDPWTRCEADECEPPEVRGIDWVIVGGESGRQARPFDLDWARAIVKQCRAAGVAVFVKQLGDASVWPLEDAARSAFRSGRIELSRGGGDPSEWPEDLRVREFPAAPQLANAPP